MYRGSPHSNLAGSSERPDYARYDALIGRRALPGPWTVTVASRTDQRYGGNSSMPGIPRTFLISGYG